MSKIIALYSPCPQCGKSTLGKMITDYGNKGFDISFAKPFKRMNYILLIDIGYSPSDAMEYVYGSKKEEIIPELGVTCRHIQQTLGSEWGKGYIHNDIWANIGKAKIKQYRWPVVVDDLRFSNEYYMLRDMGACLVRITRPGYTKQHEHSSDGALDDYFFDIELVNDGTPEEMYEQFRAMYDAWEAVQ